MRRIDSWFLFFVVFLFLSGCASPPKTIETAPAAVARSTPVASAVSCDALYDHTQEQFARAMLFKPRDDGIDERVFELAPLIMERALLPPTIARGSSDRSDTEEYDVTGDPDRVPTVAFVKTWTKMGNSKHEQFVYCCQKRSADTDTDDGSPWNHVIRITLDEGGFPIVVEELVADSGCQAVYVSSSLELEARQQFGPPLPGRRYSIERSVEETPNTIVAGVFEDGPIPMGPYLYIDPSFDRVTTVLCRCSPAQVDAVVATGYYELQPLNSTRPTCGTTWPQMEAVETDGVQRRNSDLPKKLRWPQIAH